MLYTGYGDFSNGYEDVFSIHPDGKHEKRLTHTARVNDGTGDLSRDGKWIVYASQRNSHSELMLMRSNGKRPRSLGVDGFAPAFSPNRKRIAYAAIKQDETPGICVLTLASKKNKCLSKRGDEDESPDWSPDGKRLIFVRNTDVWEMRADGTHAERALPATKRIQERNPHISPDGKSIVYTKVDYLRDYRGDIFLADRDGGHRRALTDNNSVDELAVFSPSGNRLAFISERHKGSRAPKGREVYTMDTTGHDIKQVTHLGPKAHASDVSWSE